MNNDSQKIINAKQHLFNIISSKTNKTENEKDLLYFLKKDKIKKTETVINPDSFKARLDLYLLLNKKCMLDVTDADEDIMYFILRDNKIQDELDKIF